MVCVSVSHGRGAWKLRVHVLVVSVFICLIFTVIMSFGNLEYRCISPLTWAVVKPPWMPGPPRPALRLCSDTWLPPSASQEVENVPPDQQCFFYCSPVRLPFAVASEERNRRCGVEDFLLLLRLCFPPLAGWPSCYPCFGTGVSGWVVPDTQCLQCWLFCVYGKTSLFAEDS